MVTPKGPNRSQAQPKLDPTEEIQAEGFDGLPKNRIQ